MHSRSRKGDARRGCQSQDLLRRPQRISEWLDQDFSVNRLCPTDGAKLMVVKRSLASVRRSTSLPGAFQYRSFVSAVLVESGASDAVSSITARHGSDFVSELLQQGVCKQVQLTGQHVFSHELSLHAMSPTKTDQHVWSHDVASDGPALS